MRNTIIGFAADSRKLQCSGFMKVANGAVAADFSFMLVLMILLSKLLLYLSAWASRSGHSRSPCEKILPRVILNPQVQVTANGPVQFMIVT